MSPRSEQRPTAIDTIDQFVDVLSGVLHKEEVRVIFDLGAHDARNSVEFTARFPNAHVYAFECHPEMLSRCRQNAAGRSAVTVVEKAVHVRDGRCLFFPVDPKATDHNRKSEPWYRDITKNAIGDVWDLDTFYAASSSLFRFMPSDNHHPGYVQTEGVEVESIRLDTFCRNLNLVGPDLLWMDLQGAELLALNSLGGYLKRVKAIFTEVLFKDVYSGQTRYEELNRFLVHSGFKQAWISDQSRPWGDAIYLNQ